MAQPPPLPAPCALGRNAASPTQAPHVREDMLRSSVIRGTKEGDKGPARQRSVGHI